MDRWLRLLLVVLVLAYIPGTPGLGVDTRSADAAPAVLGYVYGAAFFAPLLAVAASWKWQTAATWLALLSGVLAVVLPGLDELGVLAGPAPTGMVVLNAVVIVIGLAITWLAWRATRARMLNGAATS
jgi:hypothetical protein